MTGPRWLAGLRGGGLPTRSSAPSFFRVQPWHGLALLVILAAGVRAWQLTFHSLWLDEVFSLFWANKPAATIVRVGLTLTEDKHPPLYYLLLHGWTRLFGASDAAVRSLGVGLGALAVWPTFGLGMALNRRADRVRRRAWLAAVLVAFNPFLIWYSQEVRMFMPATTFGLWGLYAWLRALAPPTAPGGKRTTFFWYALAVSGLAAACYSYLFAAFLLPVAGLWLLVEKCPSRPGQDGRAVVRAAWPGALALLLLAALFAPLALAAWRVSGAEAAPGAPFADFFPTLAPAGSVHRAPGAVAAAAAGGGGDRRWNAPADRPRLCAAPGCPPRPAPSALARRPAAVGQSAPGQGRHRVCGDALFHLSDSGLMPGVGRWAGCPLARAALAGARAHRRLCGHVRGRTARAVVA